MTQALATTKVAIYRGMTTNAIGDEVENNTAPVVTLEAVPASLIEKSRNVQDPASGTWRTIRYKVLRPINPHIDVRDGDRFRDLSTGVLHSVDVITRTPRTIAGAAVLRIEGTVHNVE